MASTEKAITACICTYNRYDVLPKAIESAFQQSLPIDNYRIVVIDNSPDRENAAAFGDRYKNIPGLSYVIEPNPGLSNARNVAAQMAQTPFIAFMDDDAIANPTWLVEILHAFEAFGATTAIVGGRVDPIWGAPRPRWLPDSMLGNLSVVNWGGDTRVASEREWFAGTNIAFRTQAILEHGGFSQNLGRIGSGHSLLSNEELQLVERIRANGGQLVYAPRAVVGHLAEAKRLTRSWFRKRAAWQAMSDFMMDPEQTILKTKEHWSGTVDYFNTLPPHLRTIRGLVHDIDDPALFEWQVGAHYMMTAMALSGFEGIDLD